MSKVVVYVHMDINANGLMDAGEGVENLRVVLTTNDQRIGEEWTTDGVVEFSLEMPSGTSVQIAAPYLHWSTIVSAPDAGGVETATLTLAVPTYPAQLP